MITLLIFNFITIAVVTLLLWCARRYIKTEKQQYLLFIVASVATVLMHYSIFFYNCLKGTALEYLSAEPDLLLPIYPCNLLMWIAVIFGLCKNKKTRFAEFICDYIFWFGIIAALVGMFANVDFINNPTLTDFNSTKSILAHGTLLFNILLLPLFGYVKVDFFRNMRHIIYSILLMLATGLYCTLVFSALVSTEAAYDENSMFLLHSPFEGLEFLTYPVIALIAIPIYFALFTVCELLVYEKGNRYYDRLRRS